jgi:hypothetical protein
VGFGLGKKIWRRRRKGHRLPMTAAGWSDGIQTRIWRRRLDIDAITHIHPLHSCWVALPTPPTSHIPPLLHSLSTSNFTFLFNPSFQPTPGIGWHIFLSVDDDRSNASMLMHRCANSLQTALLILL